MHIKSRLIRFEWLIRKHTVSLSWKSRQGRLFTSVMVTWLLAQRSIRKIYHQSIIHCRNWFWCESASNTLPRDKEGPSARARCFCARWTNVTSSWIKNLFQSNGVVEAAFKMSISYPQNKFLLGYLHFVLIQNHWHCLDYWWIVKIMQFWQGRLYTHGVQRLSLRTMVPFQLVKSVLK